MDAHEVRVLMHAILGVEEGRHHGHPDFRIGGKVFASLNASETTLVLRLPEGGFELIQQVRADGKLLSRQGGMNWVSLPLAGTRSDELDSWIFMAIAARTRRCR